jgi:hypothetical protein
MANTNQNNASDQELGNALGLNNQGNSKNNQARSSVQTQQGQPQTQGQPQQPGQQAPPQGQPSVNTAEALGAQGQQNVSGQPKAQTQAPNNNQGQPEQSETEVTEEQISNIKQKFGEDRENIINGIVNIGEKLGKNVDTEKVQNMTKEQLINEYALAEQELGATGSQQSQNQQNDVQQQLEDYKNRVQMLTGYINQMQNGFTNPGQTNPYNQNNMQPNMQANNMQQPQQPQQNQPLRDPQTGQFVSQNQTQPNQQQTQQGQQKTANAEDILDDVEFDDYDINKMYDDPEYMKEYLSNQMKKAIGKVDQTVNQRVEQRLQAEKQQRMQAQRANQITKDLQQRAQKVQEKVGDDVYEKYRGVARQIIAANPRLAQQKEGIDPQTGQKQMDGLELAIRMAQNMQEGYNNQQQNNQQYQQQNQMQKQVAGMPNSTARTPGQPQDPNAAALGNALGINMQ